jgi:hypothetical protein
VFVSALTESSPQEGEATRARSGRPPPLEATRQLLGNGIAQSLDEVWTVEGASPDGVASTQVTAGAGARTGEDCRSAADAALASDSTRTASGLDAS